MLSSEKPMRESPLKNSRSDWINTYILRLKKYKLKTEVKKKTIAD